MDVDKLALLRTWTRALLRERVKDSRTAHWLLHELQTRGERAPVLALAMGQERWVQFAVAPHHPEAKRLALAITACVYKVSGRKFTFSGTKELRAVLLCELVRRMPESALLPAKSNSRAAQRMENLLAGANQTIVKVRVKPLPAGR